MAITVRNSPRRTSAQLVVILVLVAGMVAIAWLLMTQAPSGGDQHQALGAGDNGSTVTVAQGTVITLTLAGNPTTGYEWDATIGNPAVLEQSRAPEFKPSSTAYGAGGTYTFQLQAKSAGRSELTLLYRRSWESGVAPLQTYHVTVVVR